MEFSGKITHRLDIKSGVSNKNCTQTEWKSVEFVIEETEGQYPKKMKFRIFGKEKVEKACEVLRKDTIAVVSFDVNAREYNGSWYNDINAWKIVVGNTNIFTGESVEGKAASAVASNTNPNPNSENNKDVFGQGDSTGDSELPF